MPGSRLFGTGLLLRRARFRAIPRRWLVVVLLFITAAIAACATVTEKNGKQSDNSSSDVNQGPVLAQMGGVKLTGTYFQNLLADMKPADKNMILQNPSLAEKLLRDEILKYYLLDLSKRTGWSLRPEVIRKATQAANQAIAASFLHSKATVKESYPDETLIRETYDANRDSLRQAGQVRLAQIYIEGQSKESLNKIKQIHRELAEKPERFEAAARQYSQHDPSAANGGDLGWKNENHLLPGLAETVARMTPGNISAPLGMGQGFHIIRLVDRKQGEILTLEQARPLIVNQLRIEAAGRTESEYLQNLVKKDPIQLDSETLKQFLQNREPPKTGGDR